jgi:hypothetical protein
MNSPSPKSLKKSHNLLRKVGQKVEQTFHLSNSSVFHGSLSSLNDLPDSYYHRELGDHKLEHEDTVSLQNLPAYIPDSPRLKLKKKYGRINSKLQNNIFIILAARFGRSPAAATSTDTHSNAQWQPNAEDYRINFHCFVIYSIILFLADQSTKDWSTQYDKEMELRCKDLLENKVGLKSDLIINKFQLF